MKIIYQFLLFFSVVQASAQIKISFCGDIMLDRGVKQISKSRGFNYITDSIAPYLRQCNFNFFNLESVVTNRTDLIPVGKEFEFIGTTDFLCHLACIGFNVASTVNNHTFDFGTSGYEETINNMAKCNIRSIKYFVENEIIPLVLDTLGMKIACFGFNEVLSKMYRGGHFPKISSEKSSELFSAFKKAKAKSDFIILFCHWGIEGSRQSNRHQQEFARKAIEQGVDLIIGCHPHVLQEYELVNGKPVFYSLGNFIFDSNNPPKNRTILLKIEFENKKIKKLSGIPFIIESNRPVYADVNLSKEIFEFFRINSRGCQIKFNAKEREILFWE